MAGHKLGHAGTHNRARHRSWPGGQAQDAGFDGHSATRRRSATRFLEHRRRTAPQSKSDWMFANPMTGKPWRPHRIQQRYIRPAGLAVTCDPHIGWRTFRHTYSSMLRSLKVDVKVQQELLRHTDVRFTLNTYTQADKSQKREAVEMVARGLMDSSGLSKIDKRN